MTLNILHLPHRIDRLNLLLKELKQEKITDYKIWDGVIDQTACKGIAKAHKQIVRHAKSINLPEILIGEDDLHFTAQGAYEFFLYNKPQIFDIYLGGIMWRNNDEGNFIHDFSGLTMYIIHEQFYETFLNLDDSNDIDRQLAGKGTYILCDPMVVFQTNGYSDNKKYLCNFDRHIKYFKLYGT